MPTNIIVWNEYIHEKEDAQVKKNYPHGIHNAIAEFFKTRTRIFCINSYITRTRTWLNSRKVKKYRCTTLVGTCGT